MFLWRDISDRYCCVHTHMFINLTSLLSHILFSFPIMLFYFLISLNLLQGHSRLRADKVERSLHLMIPPLFQYSHKKVSLYSTLFKLFFWVSADKHLFVLQQFCVFVYFSQGQQAAWSHCRQMALLNAWFLRHCADGGQAVCLVLWGLDHPVMLLRPRWPQSRIKSYLNRCQACIFVLKPARVFLKL